MTTTIQKLRAAGALALAGILLAGCGGAEAPTGAQDEAAGTEAAQSSDAGGASSPAEVTYTDESGSAAIETAVPTSQVITSEETYRQLEGTIEQLEASGASDTCTSLLLDSYRMQLDESLPAVTGVVAEDALIAAGATETLSLSMTADSEAYAANAKKMAESCLEPGDDLDTEESAVGDCALTLEQYTRQGAAYRRTATMTCGDVTAVYNAMSPGTGLEGDVGEWNDEASARVTAVFAELGV